MTSILIIVLLILAVAIIALVYLQSGKVKNVGAAITGTQDVELFENTKKRGADKIIHWITIALIATFIIIAFTMLFI